MLSRKITLSLMITTATILTWSHVLAGPIETGEVLSGISPTFSEPTSFMHTVQSSPNASDDLAISNLAAAAAVDGHIYACVNAPWVQPCQNFNFVVNKCVNFPLLYQESISSIGPDVGFRCVLYQ